jgi:hypothetical protein
MGFVIVWPSSAASNQNSIKNYQRKNTFTTRITTFSPRFCSQKSPLSAPNHRKKQPVKPETFPEQKPKNRFIHT